MEEGAEGIRDRQTKKFNQGNRHRSPYSLTYRLSLLLWMLVNVTVFRGPKPLNRWRILLLKIFGAQIEGSPYVSGSSKIYAPWNLVLQDRACIGFKAEIYNMNEVRVGKNSVVSQYAYICGGSHDIDDPEFSLITAPIFIEEDVFIGAKAIVLMGTRIGHGSVVGAGSVVPKDVPDRVIVGGNPCKIIRGRDEE